MSLVLGCNHDVDISLLVKCRPEQILQNLVHDKVYDVQGLIKDRENQRCCVRVVWMICLCEDWGA